MVEQQEKTASLRALLEAASRVVIFTGAGISTESGIPDFRSPGGLWSKYKPIDFGDFMASEEMRRESWRRKFAMDSVMQAAEPNRGHRAVEKLIRSGKAVKVITQNVDGLHQESGIAEEDVIELHGNSTYAKCLGCGTRHELAGIKATFADAEALPVCHSCGGGIIKTATISFGQAMPEAKMARAQEATLACDLFIAIGSSMVVFPAAGFLPMAAENGAKVAILNREPTDMDVHADLVVNAEIGETLGDAVGVN